MQNADLNDLEAAGFRPIVIDEDFDFTELDSLLAPKPPVPDADKPDASDDEIEVADPDDLSDLDALLGEAMAERSTAQSVADARKRAKGGYALSEADLERIRRWELAKEWLPVANVALFRRYTCACGFHATVYEGLMLEQCHRHSKHANRWTDQKSSVAALPNKSAIRKTTVPMCQRCASGKGFSLVTDIEWDI